MNRMSIAEKVTNDLQDKKEWDESTGGNLFVSDEDFHRRFWNEKVALIGNNKGIVPVRVNREHFLYREDTINSDNGGFAGFGGRKFVIEFFDGRKVTTTNLWYQGEIPTDYDDLLPDNAKFVEE